MNQLIFIFPYLNLTLGSNKIKRFYFISAATNLFGAVDIGRIFCDISFVKFAVFQWRIAR